MVRDPSQGLEIVAFFLLARDQSEWSVYGVERMDGTHGFHHKADVLHWHVALGVCSSIESDGAVHTKEVLGHM